MNNSDYFLYFTKNYSCVRKFAYAPSVADPLPEEELGNVRKYLENLDAISVREERDVFQLQPLTDKNVIDVCDPVFLLDDSYWSSIACNHEKIKEPYILCYFLSVSDNAVKTVKKLRELTGLKVVHININNRDKFHSDYNLRSEGPLDFVGLIRDAAYVCTNSFHCSAFSIIFKKNFCVVGKQNANLRMENLMKKAGIKNVFVDAEKVDSWKLENLAVEYGSFNQDVAWIAESKAYLDQNLLVES
jgi:hypothetical protein